MQLPIIVLIMWLVNGVTPDPGSLLRGGIFSENPIQFSVYPMLDVLAHGIKNQLPFWTCVHGGVQVWDATVYIPLPEDNATFVLHMNSRVGGGHILSAPMYTPRKNAEYVVSMSLACNPHGGPRNQSLLPIVFDAEGNEMEPRTNPIVIVSNPNSTMENLNWEKRSFKMLGTGNIMYLYLFSLVKGYYGLLVANVQVRLANLLDNGSFEILALDPSEKFNNLTKDVVLVAPKKGSIPGWDIENGKVKVAMTGYNKAFQAATDKGKYLVELNAMQTAGEISTMFVVPPTNMSTSENHEYVMLVDTAANPWQPGPQVGIRNGSASASTLAGSLGIKIWGIQSGRQLLDETIEISTTGFTSSSVGWMTNRCSFKMQDDQTAKVTFKSLAQGSSFGPFVDNVVVYEVKDKAQWIKVNILGFELPGNGSEIANKQVQVSVVILMTSMALLFVSVSMH